MRMGRRGHGEVTGCQGKLRGCGGGRWLTPPACCITALITCQRAGHAVVLATSAKVVATVLGADIYEVTGFKVITSAEGRMSRWEQKRRGTTSADGKHPAAVDRLRAGGMEGRRGVARGRGLGAFVRRVTLRSNGTRAPDVTNTPIACTPRWAPGRTARCCACCATAATPTARGTPCTFRTSTTSRSRRSAPPSWRRYGRDGWRGNQLILVTDVSNCRGYPVPASSPSIPLRDDL